MVEPVSFIQPTWLPIVSKGRSLCGSKPWWRLQSLDLAFSLVFDAFGTSPCSLQVERLGDRFPVNFQILLVQLCFPQLFIAFFTQDFLLLCDLHPLLIFVEALWHGRVSPKWFFGAHKPRIESAFQFLLLGTELTRRGTLFQFSVTEKSSIRVHVYVSIYFWLESTFFKKDLVLLHALRLDLLLGRISKKMEDNQAGTGPTIKVF